MARNRFVVCFLLLSLMPATAGAGANLLQNPGFEIGSPVMGVGPYWAWWWSAGSASFRVLGSSHLPWAVHGGNQSQTWYAPGYFSGGIYQTVGTATPGKQYDVSVYFADPDPAGPYGPTIFRIGVEPNGAPPPGAAIWGPTLPVTPGWQQATVRCTANASMLTVVMMSEPTGGAAPPWQFPYPATRVIVDDADAVAVVNCAKIAAVPDINPPLKNPLGVPHTNNSCAPISAANITEYWDVVKADARAVGVDAGFAGNAVAPFIGFWMDTNNFGCVFRENGATKVAAPGTYVGDIAPGIAGWARWDGANGFGCTTPADPLGPALPAGKNGYSWTCATALNAVAPAQQPLAVWNQVVNEINAGRPLIVSWSYWNPVSYAPPVIVDGVEYCSWGGIVNPGSYNDADRTRDLGLGTIGHDVTAVGYCANYQPSAACPKTNWIIVHDNWAATAVDLAIPWMTAGAGAWSPWIANTTVQLQAPQVGSLVLAQALFNNPPNHYWSPGFQEKNLMARLRLTAGAAEGVVVNALTFTAAGSGNDQSDVLGAFLYDDTNANGQIDGGDKVLASGMYPTDNGTVTIPIDGPAFTIPANTTKTVLVGYWINNNPAPAGGKTFQFSLTAIYATGAVSFLPVATQGLPYGSAKKTVASLWVQPGPCVPIGLWMIHRDGTLGHIICSPVVSTATGVLGNKLYIQEQDRSAGIMVDFGESPPPTLAEGDEVDIEACITTVDGERVLVQPTILGQSPGPPPVPVSMNNYQVGGEDWNYVGGSEGTESGRPGVFGGWGMNNVGLLVRTFGMYTRLDATTFQVDDGSGFPIKCVAPAGVSLGMTWQFVAVTGVSSGEMVSGEFHRMLRVRKQADIDVLF